MKTVRGFIAGLFVAGMIGGTGGATPTVAHVITKPPAPGVSSPVPVPAFRSKPGKRSDATDHKDSKDSSTGLTGLANAIAHVSQNLADHPNKGLANALSHLQANQAKHEAKAAANGAIKSPKSKKWTGA